MKSNNKKHKTRLTGEAQQDVGRHQHQSQLGFCHLYHQTNMREPSMHLSTPLHHLNEQDAQGQEVPVLSAHKRVRLLYTLILPDTKIMDIEVFHVNPTRPIDLFWPVTQPAWPPNLAPLNNCIMYKKKTSKRPLQKEVVVSLDRSLIGSKWHFSALKA